MNYGKIKSVRQKNKISILEMADLTGVSRETISLVERGLISPNVASLEKILLPLNLKLYIK